jgi:hypothetical protein
MSRLVVLTSLVLRELGTAMMMRSVCSLCLVMLHSADAMATLSAGSNVLVVGGGSVQALAGRLSALRGFNTFVAVSSDDVSQTTRLVYDDANPEGSLPLTVLPVSGSQVDVPKVEACINEAEGLIIAYDECFEFLPEPALMAYTAGSKIKHVSLMSRSLNGEGMGFFANAAKAAANREIWNAPKQAVDAYKVQERTVLDRAAELGASTTVIRAGTLKGGASGDSAIGGSGEASFLNTFFYSLGQQDAVNWRLLYDCSALGVELSRGDSMPGPGFTAAITATAPEGGAGDSHRGGIAAALVEALRIPEAAGGDFSVASKPGKDFPMEQEWAQLFGKA